MLVLLSISIIMRLITQQGMQVNQLRVMSAVLQGQRLEFFVSIACDRQIIPAKLASHARVSNTARVTALIAPDLMMWPLAQLAAFAGAAGADRTDVGGRGFQWDHSGVLLWGERSDHWPLPAVLARTRVAGLHGELRPGRPRSYNDETGAEIRHHIALSALGFIHKNTA
jgi:hypothetical protein